VLSEYLLETLRMWAKLGVDRFRCDVAFLPPLDFWQQAREAVTEVNPDVIWLAESVHASWRFPARPPGRRTLGQNRPACSRGDYKF
jgi:glycosidase